MVLLAMASFHYFAVVRLNRNLARTITDREQVEEALLTSKILLEKIFTSQTAAIFILDMPARRVAALNPATEKMFGYREDEIVGRNISLLHVDQAHYDEFGEKFLPVIDAGGVFTMEFEMRHRDGTVFPTDHTVTEIRDERGERTQLVSVVRYITEQKRAEATTVASKARLAGILDIAPEAVITIGEDMKVQLFNQGAERIFGYEAAEMFGRDMEILLPKHLRAGHLGHIERFQASGDGYQLMDGRREICGLRKDGVEFPAAASVSKLVVGGETLFTVMLHDVSERRAAEEDRRLALIEAERANQAKSEFLATMSHELRTPLNAIVGFSDLLAHQFFGELGSRKYVEYAEDIHTSSEHLLHLVNDILDLSAIEAGEHQLFLEKLVFTDVVAKFSPIVAESAGRKDIPLSIDAPDDLPLMSADRRALKQIMLNVLSNAIKFTPNSGEVVLKASACEENHVIQVSDNGPGIPQDKLVGLTDAFVRAESNPYKTQEGTGLGLAIVKSLVELHNGRLDIESELGKGTSVTMTFERASI